MDVRALSIYFSYDAAGYSIVLVIAMLCFSIIYLLLLSISDFIKKKPHTVQPLDSEGQEYITPQVQTKKIVPLLGDDMTLKNEIVRPVELIQKADYPISCILKSVKNVPFLKARYNVLDVAFGDLTGDTFLAFSGHSQLSSSNWLSISLRIIYCTAFGSSSMMNQKYLQLWKNRMVNLTVWVSVVLAYTWLFCTYFNVDSGKCELKKNEKDCCNNVPLWSFTFQRQCQWKKLASSPSSGACFWKDLEVDAVAITRMQLFSIFLILLLRLNTVSILKFL